MEMLMLGLLMFLGVHSVRVVAGGWRGHMVEMLGERGYKGLYSLVSAVGLGLVVWGFGLARQQPVVLWQPPTGLRHLAALLMLGAFVLLLAAYVPRNHLKARIGHPMLAGVKLWALAHLLANGTLADVALFGSFLIWAVLVFVASRRRDRASGQAYPVGTPRGTALTLGAGVLAWAVFGFGLHGWLIGVRPFG